MVRNCGNRTNDVFAVCMGIGEGAGGKALEDRLCLWVCSVRACVRLCRILVRVGRIAGDFPLFHNISLPRHDMLGLVPSWISGRHSIKPLRTKGSKPISPKSSSFQFHYQAPPDVGVGKIFSTIYCLIEAVLKYLQHCTANSTWYIDSSWKPL